MSNERSTVQEGQAGFTLIELMIVVAIIGILAASLLPNFRHQVQAAHVAAAITDMRCLQTSLTHYALKNSDSPIPENLDTYTAVADFGSNNGCVMPDDPENRRVIKWWCTIVIGGRVVVVPCSSLDPQPQGYELFVRIQKVSDDYPGAVVRLSSDRGIGVFTVAQAQQIIGSVQP